MSERVKGGMTLGTIVGNPGVFPDHLAHSGHQEMKAALESAGVKVFALPEAESKFEPAKNERLAFVRWAKPKTSI